MKFTRPIVLRNAAVALLALLSSQASGQQAAPKAANPPPKIGLAFENQPPTAKFTNETGQELAIIYGPEKFQLKPGASINVAVPQGKLAELTIWEKSPGGALRPRYTSMIPPGNRQGFVPLTWARPKKVP